MPQSDPASVRPADFGQRFTAFVLDAALLFAVQWIVVIVLARQLQAAGMVSVGPCDADPAFSCEGPNTALWILLALIVIVSTFAYHAWFDGVLGATPGKRIAGLRVVSAGEVDASNPAIDLVSIDTTPIGPALGTVRSIFRQLPWIFVFFFVAGSPVAVDLPALLWFVVLGLIVLTYLFGAFHPYGTALHDLVVNSRVIAGAPIDHDVVDPSPGLDADPADDEILEHERVAAPQAADSEDPSEEK